MHISILTHVELCQCSQPRRREREEGAEGPDLNDVAPRPPDGLQLPDPQALVRSQLDLGDSPSELANVAVFFVSDSGS